MSQPSSSRSCFRFCWPTLHSRSRYERNPHAAQNRVLLIKVGWQWGADVFCAQVSDIHMFNATESRSFSLTFRLLVHAEEPAWNQDRHREHLNEPITLGPGERMDGRMCFEPPKKHVDQKHQRQECIPDGAPAPKLVVTDLLTGQSEVVTVPGELRWV